MEATARTLDRDGLDALLGGLGDGGWTVLGPVVRDGALVPGPIATTSDLPEGWGDEQAPGRYRLRRRDDDALFGFASGPQAWKRYLFPPRTLLLTLRRQDGSLVATEPDDDPPRLALVGVRACDVAAIAVQDRVFLGDGVEAPDPHYARRRERLFIVAVACSTPADTCFCASMGTGPQPGPGADITLVELLDGEGGAGHRFVAAAGSEAGRRLLAELPGRPVTADELDAVAVQGERAAGAQRRRVVTDGLPELLERLQEAPRWDDVAARCLDCANCTLACPTCFCHTVEDVTGLEPGSAERWRRWDSCFTTGFSHLHGGSVRASTKSRYRQWLTHKLGTWVAQFGTFGCVGCGRCITWCPAGIDLVAEVRALRDVAAAAGIEGERAP